MLHKLGADVSQAKNDGATPAQAAGRNGHPEVAELTRRLALTLMQRLVGYFSRFRQARDPRPSIANDLNMEDYGDRTLSFVRPVNEAFCCSICYCVMVDPTSTSCGHTFCKACLQTALSNASTCPTCRGQARPIAPNFTVKQLIGSLEVRCPNPPRNGIERPVLTLDGLDRHLSDCQCR